MKDTDSYIICSTPRTGSTLLCALLNSTGVAGHPESYFRKQDVRAYAERWGIKVSSTGFFNYADYVKAALDAGTTENDVFAMRVMWGTMEEVVRGLQGVYPTLGGKELDLLRQAFGRVRFVYLRREDVVGQAISWLRAEQTNLWQSTDPHVKAGEPRYDFDELDKLVHTINEHNIAWKNWFEKLGIKPYAITYEQLGVHPEQTILGLMDFLGLDLAVGRELKVGNKRLADSINTQWAERYKEESSSK